jgi:hypothetical protein
MSCCVHTEDKRAYSHGNTGLCSSLPHVRRPSRVSAVSKMPLMRLEALEDRECLGRFPGVVPNDGAPPTRDDSPSAAFSASAPPWACARSPPPSAPVTMAGSLLARAGVASRVGAVDPKPAGTSPMRMGDTLMTVVSSEPGTGGARGSMRTGSTGTDAMSLARGSGVGEAGSDGSSARAKVVGGRGRGGPTVPLPLAPFPVKEKERDTCWAGTPAVGGCKSQGKESIVAIHPNHRAA